MYHVISWYTIVHHGRRTNAIDCDKVLAWHTVVCHCAPWYNLLYYGIICFWFNIVYHGTPRYTHFTQCRINYGSGGSPEPGPRNSGPHNFTEIIFIRTKYIKN